MAEGSLGYFEAAIDFDKRYFSLGEDCVFTFEARMISI
jgi:hypothetical protein